MVYIRDKNQNSIKDLAINRLSSVCGIFRGSRVVQLVKCLTLDFGSGHDLTVMGSSAHWASMWGLDPVRILSPSLPLSELPCPPSLKLQK